MWHLEGVHVRIPRPAAVSILSSVAALPPFRLFIKKKKLIKISDRFLYIDREIESENVMNYSFSILHIILIFANILSIWLLLLSQELFRFFKNLNTRERKIHRELLPITHIARNALTALRGSRPLYNLLLLMLSLYFRLRLHITRERKRRIALT